MSEFAGCRPNLEVRESAPTVEFLRSILGFEVDLDEPEMGLTLLHRGAVELAVVRTGNPAVNETTAMYIEVGEVDALYEHCLAHGADIAVELTDHPWGLRDFVVAIPGGHRLAFGERTAAPQ
ncbi:VOC family protein [Nocardia sp. BMG111209]|uniref:VOC family protein n=1 Tax=Nocardia sp. BMG111209 TaxID=1160137 RepID=UPI00036DED24|nr:VOC family protein [Nocardia sp. BMG111209]